MRWGTFGPMKRVRANIEPRTRQLRIVRIMSASRTENTRTADDTAGEFRIPAELLLQAIGNRSPAARSDAPAGSGARFAAEDQPVCGDESPAKTQIHRQNSTSTTRSASLPAKTVVQQARIHDTDRVSLTSGRQRNKNVSEQPQKSTASGRIESSSWAILN